MKKIIAAVLTLALSLSSLTGLMAMAADDVTIQINGEELQIPQGDTKPFIENDRTLVPMRVIFEAFGATVDWDDATRTVTSYDVLSDVKLVLTVDSNIMYKNGEKVELDVPAKIVGDRTVVPLRAVAEGMSADVDWDGETRTVIISKGEDGKDYVEEGGTTTESGNSVDYTSLDEINAAIKANGKDVFEVKKIDDPVVVEGYNYNAGANMVEIIGEWAVGAGFPLRITIQKPAKEAEDNPDAEFVEEFDTVDEEFGVMYQMKDAKNYKYALTVHNGYSFSVYIEGRDKDEIVDEFDPSDVIKELTKTIIAGYGDNAETETAESETYDYKTLDEINAAIKANGKDVFEVKELSDPIVVEGYNYNAGTNMAEIVGEWAVGAGFPLRITIQKPAKEAEDNPDAEFVEEFDTVDEEFGVMYQMKDAKNFKYALNVHGGYSFSVYIEGRDKDEIVDEFDPADVIKSIVIDLDELYSETK